MSGLLSTLQSAGQGQLKSTSAHQAQDLLYARTMSPAVKAVDINDSTSFSAAMAALLQGRTGSDFYDSGFSCEMHSATIEADSNADDKAVGDFSILESSNPALREFAVLNAPPSKDFELLKSQPLNIDGFSKISSLSDGLALAGKLAGAIYAA